MNEQTANELQEEIVIEVHYDTQHKQVIIAANDYALLYLESILRALRESKIPGHHYHFDRATNIIEGNVNDLVLQKK
jgi:flagellin-specific chaperone FliS